MRSLFLAASAAAAAVRALAAAAWSWRMASARLLLSASSSSRAASTLAFSAWILSRCLRLASRSASSWAFSLALSVSDWFYTHRIWVEHKHCYESLLTNLFQCQGSSLWTVDTCTQGSQPAAAESAQGIRLCLTVTLSTK